MSLAHTPDDIDQSKAPLLDHLIELRRRLIYCILGFLAAFVFCYIFREDIYNFLLIPYIIAVKGQQIDMIFTALQENFFTQVRVAVMGALAISSPLLAYQIYKFVAPGLYRSERRVFVPYLVATPVLFTLGGALVFFIVTPFAIKFFLSTQQLGEGQVHIKALPSVREYLQFVTTLIIGFGLCFQLPVVLTLLARVGLVSSAWLRKQWRYAVVIIFAVAAFLTPPDLFSQISLAIPTLLLYEISILSVRFVEQQKARAKAAADNPPPG